MVRIHSGLPCFQGSDPETWVTMRFEAPGLIEVSLIIIRKANRPEIVVEFFTALTPSPFCITDFR